MRASKSVWMVSVCCGVGVLALGVGRWGRQPGPAHATAAVPAGLVYSAKGFGGYVPVAAPNAQRLTPHAPPQEQRLLQATKDYVAGRYPQVEVEAQKLARPVTAEQPVRQRQEALQAQLLLAYSAARRRDFSLAQERFAGLRDAASTLPDHGARPQALGEVIPSFEEEAAFQHAVCTGMLQGQEAAEGEYKRFVCRYPESILIHAAVKRIARYHHGDVPKDAQKLWQQAMQGQQRQELATQRGESLCGPECLAEWLRRRGQRAEVAALAQEMGTSAEGTTLLALARAARRHGLGGQGVELTLKGLAEQKLPLVALLGLGHFVLVERVSSKQVQVWDPDARGPGKSARHVYSLAEWGRQWSGMAVR